MELTRLAHRAGSSDASATDCRSTVRSTSPRCAECHADADLVRALTGGRATARAGALLLAWGVGMVGVCGLACIGPTLRALRVAPAEAMSAET